MPPQRGTNRAQLLDFPMPDKKDAVERAYNVFVLHFGTEYRSTYEKASVQLLAIGFSAALDLTQYKGMAHEIYERIMKPFKGQEK